MTGGRWCVAGADHSIQVHVTETGEVRIALDRPSGRRQRLRLLGAAEARNLWMVLAEVVRHLERAG